MPKESTKPDPEELIRPAVEGFTRRDFDAGMTPYAPNAVWDASPMGIGVYEGREAIRGLFEDWRGPYEDYEQELEEFRNLGNGVTFAVLHQRARLPNTSGFVQLRYGAVAIWADALIERITMFPDIDEARAAAERLAQERE